MGEAREDSTITWRTLECGKKEPAGGRLAFRAIRDKDGEFAVDKENHRMWFRASTPGAKADRIDIPVKAWKKHIKDYIKKNPVFAWSHQYTADGFPTLLNVLGHAADYKLINDGDAERDGLYLLDDFAYGVNPMATMAWEFYMRRDLNAVSVGWDTLEYHTEKREGKDGLEVEVYVVDNAQLLEHSGCILPMDMDALAKGRDLNSELAARVRTYADEVPEVEDAMRAYAAGDDALAEALRRVLGDPYCSSLLCDRETRPGWEDNDNQVRYQIKPKAKFNEDTYKTLSLDVKGTKDVQVHRARYKGDADDGKMHSQSISFMKEAGWTLKAAQSWWADHKEELARALESHILTRLVAQDVVDALYRDKVVIPVIEAVTAEPEPEWKARLRELAEINKDLTGDELRARLDEIKQEIQEQAA